MRYYRGRKLYGLPVETIHALHAEKIDLRHMMPIDPRGHGHPRESDPIAVILYFPYNPDDPDWLDSNPLIVIHHKAETAVQAVAEARDRLWQGL